MINKPPTLEPALGGGGGAARDIPPGGAGAARCKNCSWSCKNINKRRTPMEWLDGGGGGAACCIVATGGDGVGAGGAGDGADMV